jgi:hypothetical protein
MRDKEHIEPEEAQRILKEETPRRLDSLRRDLENLKNYLWRQRQATHDQYTGGEEQPA